VWLLKNVAGDDLLARLIASSRYKDVYEFKQWEVQKDAYIREFYEKVIPFFHDYVSTLIGRYRSGRFTGSTVSSLRFNPYPPYPMGKSSSVRFNIWVPTCQQCMPVPVNAREFDDPV